MNRIGEYDKQLYIIKTLNMKKITYHSGPWKCIWLNIY